MKKFLGWVIAAFISISGGALIAATVGQLDEVQTTYGNSSTAPGVAVQRARGHAGDKEHLYTNDIINGLYGLGYNSSAFTTSSRVSMELQASQNWTTTANGTKILLKTTPDDSTTPATIATFGQDGNLTLTGGLTTAGLNTTTPAAFTIGAATTIVPTSEFITLVTTGTGVITWDCTASCISTSVANGTLLNVMSSTSTNITWTDSTNIQLSTTATSSDRVFSNVGDNILLRLLSGVWYEVSFSTGHE